MSAVAVVAPINLSALPTDTVEEFVEAREIARALRGWLPQTDIVIRNGVQVEEVRRQNDRHRLPIYYKPGSNLHHNAEHGYNYEFAINDLTLPGGQQMWELVLYFVGTPTAPEAPKQVFYRQYEKARYRMEVIREFFIRTAAEDHAQRKTYEWAKNEGKAHLAAWLANPDAVREFVNQRTYRCQQDLARARNLAVTLRNDYLRAEEGGDQEEIELLTRKRRDCRASRDGIQAELARLNTLVTSHRAAAPTDDAPWGE